MSRSVALVMVFALAVAGLWVHARFGAESNNRAVAIRGEGTTPGVPSLGAREPQEPGSVSRDSPKRIDTDSAGPSAYSPGMDAEARRAEEAVALLAFGKGANRRDALSMIQSIGAPAIRPLLELLRTGDLDRQKRALSGLEWIESLRDPSVIAPLMECLEVPALRAQAYRVLHKLGPLAAEAAPKMAAQLGNERDSSVLIKALVAIGPGALKPVIAATGSRNLRERRAAVAVLARMHDVTTPEVLDALVFALTDADDAMRMLAIDGLSMRGEAARPALDAVRRATGDTERVVRKKATTIVRSLEKN